MGTHSTSINRPEPMFIVTKVLCPARQRVCLGRPAHATYDHHDKNIIVSQRTRQLYTYTSWLDENGVTDIIIGLVVLQHFILVSGTYLFTYYAVSRRAENIYSTHSIRLTDIFYLPYKLTHEYDLLIFYAAR